MVVPAYNEEKYLAPLLDSLKVAIDRFRARSNREVEIIVVDNASTDATARVAVDHGARVVREGKRQIAAARNAGARAARGEIIVTCDADNLVSANILERIDEVMSSDRCVGGGVRIIPEESRISGSAAPGAMSAAIGRWTTNLLFGFFNRIMLFFGMSFGVLFTDRDTFWRVGGFPESVYVGEDGFFVLALKWEALRSEKKFFNIRDAHIVTSLRKINEFGLMNILWQHFKFLLMPWRIRRAEAAPTWYEVRK